MSDVHEAERMVFGEYIDMERVLGNICTCQEILVELMLESM